MSSTTARGLRAFNASTPAALDAKVDLRHIHSNSTGYIVKRSRDNSYDWLYVLDVVGAEYLIKKCFSNRRSVTLRETDMLGAVAESG